MKIFAANQMRVIDAYTIENEPIASIDLMERAALRLAGWYVRHIHTDQKVIIFAGPGNNGGDALAMARLLAESQYRIECYLLKFGKVSEDCRINLERLKKQGKVHLVELDQKGKLPEISRDDVVVDGIFGSGLTRKVEGFPGKVIQYINAMARTVVAIDIPSGLFGEDNCENDYSFVIQADYTLTFQFPFLSFFFDTNNAYVGRWRVHDIKLHPEAIAKSQTSYQTLEPAYIASILPSRNKFAHKGSFGHALMIAGSYGMMGAALLSAEAVLRSGSGLLTLHLPRLGYNIIQTGLPEAIVSLDQSDILFSEPPDLEAFSAIGIGPGLGKKPNTAKGLKMLIDRVKFPLVLDADALNLLAEHPEWYNLLPEGSVLTPHPKEFDRLAGHCTNSYQRHLLQKKFARQHQVVVVLKGAHTGIASPDGSFWFNTTGNPGMATGGSGDVLTGMITGLMAQGISSLDAALAGVYLHGLAGDLAADALSEEALIASDLLLYMGEAFRELKG